MTTMTIEAAAAAAGMSERTARTWKSGPMPSQTKKSRAWRTRKDPFEDVWDAEILPLLRDDDGAALEATTILDELMRRYPERFEAGHLRTLQRRMRDWRALHGPEREVYFAQEHVPAHQAAYDFTCCNELRITIAGAAFPHLLFHLLLTFSKWPSCHARVQRDLRGASSWPAGDAISTGRTAARASERQPLGGDASAQEWRPLSHQALP